MRTEDFFPPKQLVPALPEFEDDKVAMLELKLAGPRCPHDRQEGWKDSGFKGECFGNYANAYFFMADYESLLKTNWNLHHRPRDSKKLLWSGKTTPVCQHEVFKKKHCLAMKS